MAILPNRDRGDRFVPGGYYTDGSRLLRIVSEADCGRLRAVEDCKTLELMLVEVDELERLGLRPVAAKPRANPWGAATPVPA